MPLNFSKQRGFNLIEVVMVILIISVISVVVGKIMWQGLQSFQGEKNITEVDWQGFTVLKRLTDDIHSIRSAASITTSTASQLTFVNVQNVTIPYVYSSGTLTRNSVTLASGITSFTFAYLDKNGAVTATADNIRYITITLSLTQNNISTSFTTLVGIRGIE